MKKKLLFLVVLLCSMAATVTTSYAQDTDFWFAPPTTFAVTNAWNGRGGFMFTNTTSRTATVRVEHFKSGRIETFTIPPKGGYHLAYATWADVWADLEVRNTDVGKVMPGGVHITSDEKIMAYYFYDCNAIKDMYTLKGKNALGTEFYAPQSSDGYWLNQFAGLLDHIAIMATENGTQVTFTPTRDCHRGGATYVSVSSPYGILGTYNAGTTYTETLNAGEVLVLCETVIGTAGVFNTLAGTHITSNKSIVVTTDESCTGLDEIGDQLTPIDKTGTLYVVTKGYTQGAGITEHIYIESLQNGTEVFVNASGTETSLGIVNEGDFVVYDMGDRTAPPYAVSIRTTHPAYCYHIAAASTHPAGALIPSIYSIGQNRFSFYQMTTTTNDNMAMVVFREDCDTTFTISYAGVSEPLIDPVTLAVASGVTMITPSTPIPGVAGWNFMRFILPTAANEQVVTLSNHESSFSLGYFSGDDGGGQYCAYGYLSGFGEFEFDPDTIWRCASNARPVTLIGGYARSYKWTFPDGSIKTTPTVKARDPGMYILEMDQDFRISIDTCWVLDMTFNAEITKQPALPKPAKVGVPQIFSSTVNTDLPDLTYDWTFEGGNPATSQSAHPKVTWNTTGQKTITLKLTARGAAGKDTIACDTTIIMDLMIREKNIGYFVDKDRIDGEHDGSNWQNAFQQVYDALDVSSQGDCIWVADGTYQPKADGKSFVMDYDSVEMYGGFGGWEANINERDVASHQTILSGRGSNVVTFDGSNSYTSGSCGVSRATRLDGFIVQDGEATDGAGITFINGASGTVAYCIIKRNTATGNGGGIYIGGTYGGCEIGSEDPLLVNNEVSGNRAALGAGIYNNGSKFLSVNNTIAGNSSKGASGLYNEGDADLRNTIIWGNLTDGALGKDVTNGNGTPVYSYCNISGWSTALGQDGTHNIDKNPVFLRKGYSDDYTMREGNYQLSNGSPSVDKGRNAYVLADLPNRISTVLLKPVDAKYGEGLTFDLAGLNRIENDIVDMGAYEFHPDTTFQSLVHEVVIGTYPNMTTEPAAGIHQAIAHSNFTMTLTPDAGYSLNYITITTGSDYQDNQGAMVVMHNPDGTVTVVFKEVSDPLNVKINGISPTASEAIEGVSTLWANSGNLYVQVAKASQLSIYTVTGQLYKQQTIGAGETVIPLAQGVYVVTVDNGTKQKIVIK